MNVETQVEFEDNGIKLHEALLIYGGNYKREYVVRCGIENKKTESGKVDLVPEKIMELSSLQRHLSTLTGKRRWRTYYAHERLIFHNETQNLICWHLPMHTRALHFSKKCDLEQFNGVDVTHPNLIFTYGKTNGRTGNSIGTSVYAHFDEGRPGPETQLHLTAFYNTDDAGKVCVGNGNINRKSSIEDIEIIDMCEKNFFLTEFTHIGSGANLKDGISFKTYMELNAKITGSSKGKDLKRKMETLHRDTLIPAGMKIKDLPNE